MSLFSFFYQPVFHVLGFALAFEVELDVVQGIANLLERGVWIEVLAATSPSSVRWLITSFVPDFFNNVMFIMFLRFMFFPNLFRLQIYEIFCK